ncbi:MAG: hypothetical protein ACJAQS_001297 [Porticoccus sp.]|jgi:hypothetical protein
MRAAALGVNRQIMNIITKGLVIFSLLFNLAVVMVTIFSESAVSREFSDYSLFQYIQTLALFVLIVLIACWPWLAAFLGASDPSKKNSATIFSVLSILASSVLFLPKYTGPTEGIGYNILLLIAGLWVAYPICLLFNEKSNES